MLSIPYPSAFPARSCPVCPELVSVRRQIEPANFACRYWVECSTHGVITDLSTWLDLELREEAA